MNQAPTDNNDNDINSNNDTERGWEMKDMSIGEDRTANAVMTWITK